MAIEAIIARYGLVALFVGAGLEGETVVAAGGAMARAGLFPLPAVMAAAAAGSFAADQIFFAVGRGGRETRLGRWARAKPGFARALGFIERRPVGFSFAFRFIYGLRTVSPFAIGTTAIRARLFFVVNLVSAIVWGVAFAGLGYLAGHAVERVIAQYRPSWTTLALIGAAVAAVAVAVHAWHRRTRVAA